MMEKSDEELARETEWLLADWFDIALHWRDPADPAQIAALRQGMYEVDYPGYERRRIERDQLCVDKGELFNLVEVRFPRVGLRAAASPQAMSGAGYNVSNVSIGRDGFILLSPRLTKGVMRFYPGDTPSFAPGALRFKA